MDLLTKLKELAAQNIFPYVHFESTGSDEWCYAFTIDWIPKEFENAKRRCPHLETKRSFFAEGSYVGGWDTVEEAWNNCFEYIAKHLIVE